MANKPTYEELEKSVKDLRREVERLKDAEERSHESEKRLNAILDATTETMVVLDREGIVYAANQIVCDRLGTTKEELIGKRLYDFFPPNVAERRRKKYNEVFNTGKPVSFEDRREGMIFEQSVYPILDDGDQVIMVAVFANDKTERKQAEEALQESEVFWKTLINAIPTPVFYKDRDGKYLGFNSAFETFFGETKERLIGKSVFDINPPELAETYHAQDDELFNSGGVQLYKSQVKNAYGKLRDVIFNKAVFTDSKGAVTGLIGTIIDITARRQAEKELRESEEKYRDIFNNAQVGIFRTRISDGKVLECNDRFARTYGYKTPEECMADFVVSEHYTDPGAREKMVASLMEKGEVTDREACFSPKDGKDVWIRFSARAYPEEGYLEGVGYDITEEKKALEALRESQEKYRNLVEESFDGISIQKGPNIIFANKRLNEMLGYREGELIGQNHWVVYHPDYQKLTRERAEARMRGEEVVRRYEVKLQRKDGSWFYGEVNARPITFPSDEESGIQVWVKDINERKQAEEALRESEERMDLAMEGGDIGLWDWNLRTGEVFFDRRWHKSLGYSPGDVELNPRSWEKVIHPEDWPGSQQALMDTLRGKIPFYEKEARLKCKSGQWRWMLARAKIMERDSNGKALRIIGTLQDINDRKLMEIELQIKTIELEETNIALNVLLKRREMDKEEVEEKVVSNVKALIEPYLKKLKKTKLTPTQDVYLNILQSNIGDILSPFLRNLAVRYSGLTPKEIEVGSLVKEGKNTEEIAELLNTTKRAVEFHRHSLRKKLGLKNTKANLKSYLISLP